MLTYFSVKNYRNFKKEFWLEFRVSEGSKSGYLSKILVTGKNGTGKSNLCRALMDIRNTFMGYVPYWDDCDEFLNADSDGDTARFHYGFKFKNEYIDYAYEKSSQDVIVKEELKLGSNVVFSADFRTGKIIANQPQLYHIGARNIEPDRYPDISAKEDSGTKKMTSFLRWLFNNTTFSYDCILMQISTFIMKMDLVCPASANASRWALFTKGLKNETKLRGLERFLNEMDIECRLVMDDTADTKELCLAYSRPIPFIPNASSGTLALCMLYDAVILSPTTSPSLLIVDELDGGLSEESAERAAKYLANITGQVILTTHSCSLGTKGIFERELRMIGK